MLSLRRTTVASVLVAIAVLIPTGAWWITGNRSVRHRLATLEADALSAVRTGLDRHAERLGSRMEALRVTESARPFYHYQNLYHDPRGAAQGLAVIPSPLAIGAADPLIRAHFQIDNQGQVSLPTVNEQFPELSADQGFAMYCDFLSALQEGMLVTETGQPMSEQERVIVLARTAWEQNLLADAVYASLRGRDTGQAIAPERPGPDSSTVVVRVSPLRWHTIMLGSGVALAALREVVTPSGTMVQGFALASEAVIAWLDAGALEFTPYPTGDQGMVTAAVWETGWHLQQDAGPALVAAAAEAEATVSRFHRRFAAVAGAALFAALAVVVMVAQADRLARQRARFAAAAAHELKTPLSSLRLYSEMLAENLGDPARSHSYAGRIAIESARLGRVVTNMLDLSRLERGTSLVQVETIDLAEVVTTCVARLRPALEQAGMTINLAIDDDLPEISCDPDALCQILHNLLDNAEKHTRGTAERQVQVATAAGKRAATITVADNGPGLPRSRQKKLFEPFARGADAAPAGLGLGLALARSLARAQGGDLSYRNDNGARFTITLQLAQP
jgi:signal transduction histidine kinase